MNQSKLALAQLTQHLPPTTLRRCVPRYGKEHKVNSFSCLHEFLCMFFAQSLIRLTRLMYAMEPVPVDLEETVYAPDLTTMDRCLSLLPWAPFRSIIAAIKLHTLLDLRGAIPTIKFISDSGRHDVNVVECCAKSNVGAKRS